MSEQYHNEECIGCGYNFDDCGTGRNEVEVWNYDSGDHDVYDVCDACYTTSHSWNAGKPLDPVRSHINYQVNRIMAELAKVRVE